MVGDTGLERHGAVRATQIQFSHASCFEGRKKVEGRACKGERAKCWWKIVATAARKRRRGGGRTCLNESLGDELWHWFVDRISNLTCRVTSAVLKCKAESLAAEVRESWQQRAGRDEVNPNKPPRLPVINPGLCIGGERLMV